MLLNLVGYEEWWDGEAVRLALKLEYDVSCGLGQQSDFW